MGNLTNKQKSIMFRFVALFALVAVAFAEPEADSQFVYSNVAGVPVHGVYNTYAGHVVSPVVKPVVTYNAAVPVVKPVVPAVPVVKYVNPHHTEGMTKEGVPEKTDSVKIAEKQHEYAQAVEKVKNAVHYVAPYTAYAGYPYVHHPVAAHVVAKREADSEADPAVFYNAYGTGNPCRFHLRSLSIHHHCCWISIQQGCCWSPSLHHWIHLPSSPLSWKA